jgi:osmotically-inducible protein OsmY
MAVATLTASCATTPPPAPPSAPTGSARAGQAVGDELLASAVYSKLNADPTYYFRHVQVSVDHGVANLTGYVWSTDALYGARRIAGSVPGITQVLTAQLELERNGHASGVTR